MRVLVIFFSVMLLTLNSFGQGKATLFGKVISENGTAITAANVVVVGRNTGTTSNANGYYELSVPSGRTGIVFAHTSYRRDTILIEVSDGQRLEFNYKMTIKGTILEGIKVKADRLKTIGDINIDPQTTQVIPTVSGGIESTLKTLPGVVSNNETSSQYNVRGGNYDENLVYVNDIEIYRPFLVRAGQQEGLSFPNIDLIKGIKFNAGGFDAKYGDKMSSVLDITYRTPEKFAGTASGSLLGGALHLEGVFRGKKDSLDKEDRDDRYKKVTFLMGARHRTNKYILGGLDTKGQYFPNFSDAQVLITYPISRKWEISGLAHYSRNKYTFIPEDRQTKFGTVNSALQLQVYFDGQEVNSFETILGAFSATYSPVQALKLKFISSMFNSYESETFDVEGYYRLQELENDFGSEELGEAKADIGVGGYINHARNYLDATVINNEHKGTYTTEKGSMAWGLRYQRELISDELSEWNAVDSAGYFIPQAPKDEIQLRDVVRTNIGLNSNRINGYWQESWFFKRDTAATEHALTVGGRFNYWDVNKEFVWSPRVNYSVKPKWKNGAFVFRLAGGAYHQPPFYRELRDLKGNINRNIKAQKSWHIVAGSDYEFKAWGRDFKFVGEFYYKFLDDLVPYEIDNVRIRYYADNIAHGYATGIDLKVNGEFVKGLESWFSLSVMQTQEDIENDFYYEYYNDEGDKIIPGFTANNIATDSVRFEPGYIPRPTDQRVNVGIFFQDNLPKLEDFKMHLSLILGTGMPFGPPSFERYKDTLRIPPYRRVDIGFSYVVLGEKNKEKVKTKKVLKHLNSIWISAEVFNLLQVSNTISYLWVTDVDNRRYAVPNFLTSRQLNLKLIVKF